MRDFISIRNGLGSLAGLFCLLAGLLGGGASPARAGGGLAATGIHGYEEDGQGRFLSFYNDTAALSLDQLMTPAARMSESVRYGWQYREGSVSHEEFSPEAALDITNDIFVNRLAVSRRETRYNGNRPGSVRTSMQEDISSAWRNHLYPKLHLGVGSDRDYTDSQPRLSDQQTDRVNSSLSWGYGGTSLEYDYSHSRTRDHVNNSDSDHTNHLVKAGVGRSFWDGRVHLALNHLYSFETSKSANTASAAGIVMRKLLVSQALSGVDDTPLTGALTNNPGLNDTDTTAAAASPGPVTSGYNLNLAVRLDLQTADYLYLYTTADVSSVTGAFTWSLYTSSDGTNWTQRPLNSSSVTYDAANLRFKVPTGGVSAVYVKVVLDYTTAATTPSFSEVEAYDESLAAPGATVEQTTDVTTNQTGFSTSWSIMPDLTLSYNLSLYRRDYDPGRDEKRRSHVANLAYSPSRYLDATLSLNDSWHEETGELDGSTRSYGLALGSSPLDTLDVHGGGTYTENRRGGVLLRRTYHYTGDITARLYPDLGASYNVTHDTTKTEATGATAKSFNQTIDFNAALTPALGATLAASRNESTSASSKSVDYTAELSFSWHPGDMLSSSLTGTRHWNRDGLVSRTLSANLSVKTTVNTQLDLRYTLTDKGTTTQGGSAIFRWNVLPWLDWQNVANYSSTRSNEFTLKTTLTANFSTY